MYLYTLISYPPVIYTWILSAQLPSGSHLLCTIFFFTSFIFNKYQIQGDSHRITVTLQ